MPAHPSHLRANAATHSLIHWLALSGVTFATGDQPAQHQAVSSQNSINQDAHNNNVSGHPAGAPTKTHTGTTRAAPDNAALRKTGSRKTAPHKAPSATAPSIAINIDTFTSLKELENFYTTWKAIGLAKTASQAVLPSGNLSSPRLLIISDLPDDYEDRHGQAFSSPSNQAIRTALQMAGFAEQEIAFTYLSKWRTPAKRPLTHSETDICMQLLTQEIAFIAPEAILTLGESTIRALVPDSATKSIKNMLTFSYTNQVVNKRLTVFASPKSDFLLKNPVMKKSFWFSLLDLASRSGA